MPKYPYDISKRLSWHDCHWSVVWTGPTLQPKARPKSKSKQSRISWEKSYEEPTAAQHRKFMKYPIFYKQINISNSFYFLQSYFYYQETMLCLSVKLAGNISLLLRTLRVFSEAIFSEYKSNAEISQLLFQIWHTKLKGQSCAWYSF